MLKRPPHVFDRSQAIPAVAIFARAPCPGRAKTRLIPLLGPQGAADLQAALILDTRRKVGLLSARIDRWLFLAGSRHPHLRVREPWHLARQRGANLGRRLEDAFRRLLARHPAAVVIGTDSPLLPPRILRAAVRSLRSYDSVLGPCPDGGFYLIGLRRFVSGLMAGVRWGTRFAFQDIQCNLSHGGLTCSILEAVPDLDRPADLRALAKDLAQTPSRRMLAPTVWRFVKPRFGGLARRTDKLRPRP